MNSVDAKCLGLAAAQDPECVVYHIFSRHAEHDMLVEMVLTFDYSVWRSTLMLSASAMYLMWGRSFHPPISPLPHLEKKL